MSRRINKEVPELSIDKRYFFEPHVYYTSPLTSTRAVKKAIMNRRAINKLNKDRAKNMERQIARDLGGTRTPMSGAAQFVKGDVSVELVRGIYFIVECKLSSMIAERNGPILRLQFSWLKKIKDEARIMRAQFGITIIKFMHQSEYFVVVEKDIFIKYFGDIYTTITIGPVEYHSYCFSYTQLQKQEPLEIVYNNYGDGVLPYYVVSYSRFKELINEYRTNPDNIDVLD
jgi:hypothetical protein